jgi:hypothetical protein
LIFAAQAFGLGWRAHRAAHFLIDDPPKILADPFARAFAGFSSDDDFASGR